MEDGSLAEENRYGDYASGIRVERTLAYLASIPDPIQRVKECEEASEQARRIQAKIAVIRRKAVYEATLRPGASGESVAAELAVTPKAVSAAISEFRKADLMQFRHVLSLYGAYASTALSRAELAAAQTTRDVLVAARTVLRAGSSRNVGSESAEIFGVLDEAENRARFLAGVGRIEVPDSLWKRHHIAQSQPNYSDVPVRYQYLARILNSLPKILADVSDSGGEDNWMISWRVRPAEPYSTVFDAGPHRDGWATTEWLVWLFGDYMRSGYDVYQYPSSPPPYLNEPGESLSFVTMINAKSDRKVVDPNTLAAWIIEMWNETGYVEVAWPSPEATE